jgi:SAM-dependent methyltransferase
MLSEEPSGPRQEGRALLLLAFPSAARALEGARPSSSRRVRGVQTLRDRPNARPNRFDLVFQSNNGALLALAASTAAEKARWVDMVSVTLGVGAGLSVATPPTSPQKPEDAEGAGSAAAAAATTAEGEGGSGDGGQLPPPPQQQQQQQQQQEEEEEEEEEQEEEEEDGQLHATAAAAAVTIAAADGYLAHLPPAQRDRSWRANIGRGGGFWADAQWYDAQIDRRMPGVSDMLAELTAACPPLGRARVADLCAGSGRAAAGLAAAYPTASLTLIDTDEERLAMAAARLPAAKVLHAAVGPDTQLLPGAPYDVIVASLALRVLVSRPAHYFPEQQGPPTPAEMRADFAKLLRCLHRSLSPGGHVLIADHDGALSLFEHLKGLEAAGFEEVDCSWRQREYFVCGGKHAVYDEM